MQEVVITGIGIACPLGIDNEAIWSAIEAGQSGVRTVDRLAQSGFPITMGGEVPDFDPKQHVKPRKSLKVMCRETQLAFTAAELAWADGMLSEVDDKLDRDRLGVVLGANVFRSDMGEMVSLYQEASVKGKFDFGRWDSAMKQLYPLWMLKYLPNMAACHVGIAKDARGPNNSITEGNVSSLGAVIEGADYIARGRADVVLTGATGSLLSWVDVVWHGGSHMSRNNARPEQASRPFDRGRDGFVASEGAAVLVLESREHARKRGAKVYGHILGSSRRLEPVLRGQVPSGQAVRQVIAATLDASGKAPEDVGFVCAQGMSTREDDAMEAAAISEVLGDNVSVTAPKSFMGNSGASGGAIDLAISLLALERNLVPPTLNCDDCDCPIRVESGLSFARQPNFISLNHKLTGQSMALLVSRDET